jgi:tetratricopeptide (TPR) repeat protein
MARREDVFNRAMSQGHSAAWDQQWEKAAASYQAALEEFPDNPKALTSLGLALFELKQFEEALKVYLEAEMLTPNDPMPLEKVGQISESMGDTSTAIDSFLKAAELYVKAQDADKAMQIWLRITQLDPNHIPARSYLAMVHERLGHAQQAVTEYLAIASLFQHSGDPDQAADMVKRALHLLPKSPEALHAQTILKKGQMLPKLMRPQGGTGQLRMAEIKQLKPAKIIDTDLDPIAEARKKALGRLAEVLFELSDEAGETSSARRGSMQSIVRGNTGLLHPKSNGPARIVMHLGQAIDAQTKDQDELAAEELEKAVGAGFSDPAAYFNLGLLRAKTERRETALRNLQTAVKHDDYAMASRLLLAQIHEKAKNLSAAATEYLRALKIADSQVVPAEQSAEISQLYEPLIEAVAQQKDAGALSRLINNVKGLLLRANWRGQVLQAREQLPKTELSMSPIPLAEFLAQAQSGQVIEAIARVRELARAGYLRTAMDEAFEFLKSAPTYLPLHTLVGDLLIEDGRTQDAIAKYTVVASAYSVSGESKQAINLLRRIVQVAPMDQNARSRLIDQLSSNGQVDEAIGEYIDLADTQYRLAELDMARKTYTTALRLAQQGGANRGWTIKLLQRMADIDMQRLDWRQAMRVYEQLRTLDPDNLIARENLIDLNLRLNQTAQAVNELENCLYHLQGAGRSDEAILLLEDMLKNNPKQTLLQRALASVYHQAGRIKDAVSQMDSLAENLLSAGDQAGAIEAIEAIIAMNPPNLADYRLALTQLKSGSS